MPKCNVQAELEATLTRRHNLDPVVAEELYALLVETAPLEFSTSKQLSEHIVANQLGRKYRNISGVVRMQQSGVEWDFEGGFPPRMYRIICTELGLVSQGTTARPVGFTSFKELLGRT